MLLDGGSYYFSNWVEEGEVNRGHLRHKAWIRLHNWPVLSWSEAEVKAAVSGFGELWEVDDLNSGVANVAYFRALVRCQDALRIPESPTLMVEDRRFRITIEVEEWEDAEPILLGEALDQRLGRSSRGAQKDFINCTGFSDILASSPAVSPWRATGGN